MRPIDEELHLVNLFKPKTNILRVCIYRFLDKLAPDASVEVKVSCTLRT